MPHGLRITTREIDPVEDPLLFADASSPLVWLRRGDGLIGTGVATTVRMDVPSDRAEWESFVAAAQVHDDVQLPGTGPIAFGSFPFDPASPAGGVLVIPRAVIGRRDGRSWLTEITSPHSEPLSFTHAEWRQAEPLLPAPHPYGPHWSAALGPGAQTAPAYQNAVRRALSLIEAGALEKVVLARDLHGTIPASADLRRLVRALASGYPDTWTFAVDGLIGASPETLITARDGVATARVLAGTTARGADADADTLASAALSSSVKDLDEHGYAVRSLLASLRPHVDAIAASEQPFILRLPNLFHLATDVEADLSNGSTVLDLVDAAHPTAAVAGTPTAAAVTAIRDLEPFDRGRYAGAVGWVDAEGNGEWAIALRCAQFSPITDGAAERALIAYAGAGIVAGSDPDAELLETRIKFRPIVDALT